MVEYKKVKQEGEIAVQKVRITVNSGEVYMYQHIPHIHIEKDLTNLSLGKKKESDIHSLIKNLYYEHIRIDYGYLR